MGLIKQHFKSGQFKKAGMEAAGSVTAMSLASRHVGLPGTLGAGVLGAAAGGAAADHIHHFNHGMAHSGPTVGMSKPAGGPKGLAAHATRSPIQKP